MLKKINATGNPGCTLFNSECTISAKNTLRIGPGENSEMKCKRAAFTLCVHAVSRCRCGRRLRYRRSAAGGRSAAPALRVERRPDATAGAATNLWPPPPCRRPPSTTTTTTTTTTRRLRPSTPPRRRPAAVPQVSKSVSDKSIAVRKVATPLRELTCHGITQYYLPPGRGDIPAVTPAEAGTRLSDPGGMQG